MIVTLDKIAAIESRSRARQASVALRAFFRQWEADHPEADVAA